MVLTVLVSALMLYGFGELIDTAVSIRSAMDTIDTRLETVEKYVNEKNLYQETTDVTKRTSETKRAEPKEREVSSKMGKSFLEKAAGMYDATEIAEEFEKQYGMNKDANIQEMLYLLYKCGSLEGSHGNMKSSVMKLLDNYFKSGMKVYSVERIGKFLKCPACGKEQKSNRMFCDACGVLFSR